MPRTALVVLLLAYLPGALLFRIPLLDRARRAALAVEERLFWAVVLSATLTSVVAFALAAAGSYALERVLVVNGALCLGIALAWRSRLRLGPEAPKPTRTAAMPLALLALACGLFFLVPPAEYVNGGRDPAVYFNSGIQIAQGGSLVIDDPLVPAIPAEFGDLFFRLQPESAAFDSVRFLGFFVVDQEAGTVVGQFPHLYPIWIAIAYDTLGLTGSRYVHGLWAVLGVLAVYFAGAFVLGRRAAFAGAALLAVHVAQVWFARYFCAEMIVQPLVFAGVLAHARAHVEGDRFFAPVAALLLGLTVFAHILGVVIVGAACLATFAGRADRKPVLASFLAPLVAVTAVSGAYYLTVLAPYAPLWFLATLGPLHGLLAAGAALVAGAVWVALRRAETAATVRAWLPRALVTALWLLAAYALFVREGGDRNPDIDPYWMRLYTEFYLLPAGLAAALAGWVVVSGQRFWRAPALFVVAATFAVFIFYNARITPDHFWAARRYVLIILPISLLLIGAAAFTRVEWLDGRRLPGLGRLTAGDARTAAGAILVAALAWSYGQATSPILTHVEHAGMIPLVEQLAARLAPDDLLLVGPRSTTDVQVTALPLAYIHNRQVLLLASASPDTEVLGDFLDWARGRHSRVLFIGGGGTDLLSKRTTARLVTSERRQIPHYERALNAYPNGVVDWQIDYGIYEFERGAGGTGTFSLDVGAGDDLYVYGMHPKDAEPSGVTYRWTRERALVRLVGTRPDAATLTLRMRGRPAAAGEAVVRVFLDDRPLGTIAVAADRFEAYSVAIPPDLARQVAERPRASELRLETEPWVPLDVLGIPDARALGVMLDRVEVR